MAVPEGLTQQDVGSPVFAPDLKSYIYAYTRIAPTSCGGRLKVGSAWILHIHHPFTFM